MDFSDTLVVLQARMGSKRYPGKMMTEIAGRPFLERVLMRVEAGWPGERVLAIPESPANDPMAALGAARGWRVHRGSDEDVLGRFASVVRVLAPRAVIRICGDSPLTEPEAVARVAEALTRVDCARVAGYPQGIGAEGATAAALLEADRMATEPYDREHVMPWIYREADAGRLRREILATDRFPATRRLTVDTAEDVAFFRDLFAALGDAPTITSVLSYPGVRA